jgi:hypothetical protein
VVGKFDSYVIIAKALVESRISPGEFETLFLSVFRGEGDVFTELETGALHTLFSDVDAYCGDPGLRSPGDLDDDGLVESARKFLRVVEA